MFGWSVQISFLMEFCIKAKVPSARRISVSSAKQADHHVIVFVSSGRNIVNRSFSFNVEWCWRGRKPVCSLHVGPRWLGPPLWSMVRREHLNLLAILMGFSRWHPTVWSVSRIASIHVCPCCMGIWRSMDLEQGFPRIRSLWGRVCLFMNQGVEGMCQCFHQCWNGDGLSCISVNKRSN